MDLTRFGYVARVQPSFWRVTSAVALVAFATSVARPAQAQLPTASAPREGDGNVSAARPHFERALELYRGGRYAEALPELEEAARLDPLGKDLFFNLALVHEKLGQLPEAISALERFRELETDAAERERARLTIERLRGAEQAARSSEPAPPPCPTPAAAPAPAAVPPSPAPPRPLLIGAASVAVVSALVGTIFGVKALSEDVSDTPTSQALPLSALRERARRAERDALVADVAFSLALASSATFAGVWLLTPTEPRTRAAGLTLRGYF
jgi:tetratricopeptide (TPR) repeat protein